MYTNEEKLDIIFIYGKCRKNAVRVRQLHTERRPGQNILPACKINNICWRLLATGSQNATNYRCSKPVMHEENKVAILFSNSEQPTRSWNQSNKCYLNPAQISHVPPVTESETMCK
jgi:hypothetical protein